MTDTIILLPDHIANQIAAGEVIQRPASAVKELLENAVDAGATDITLIVNDAGKSLVQVIDNGSGMSETDARMCFERHATSKIKKIDDLFHIRTMGFRGEALASIAAVAQVQLKTKRAEDEHGMLLEIENSTVTLQEPVAWPKGTSIAMKNLFFNVPARRNFLKSNAVEMRHIIDEFTRVALAFPEIKFELHANGVPTFQLESGSLKQRIVQLLGNNLQAKLVGVKEDTDYLNIYGFTGKPETSKKTRGDQYFFVNNRFIKSAYLNHAVKSAYQQLIPDDSFPLYVLFIELDPNQIDVNVHPTKQEIKFEDEKIIYAFVQAAVKHALAQYSITPTLDFDLDAGIQQLPSIQQPFTENKKQEAASGKIFQGFTQKNQAHFIERPDKSAIDSWSAFQAPLPAMPATDNDTYIAPELQLPETQSSSGAPETDPIQIARTYILIPDVNGFYLVAQQLAHERILYEKYLSASLGKPIVSQQIMYPVTLNFSAADALLLREVLPDLQQLGFNIEHFGSTTFLINGSPADLKDNEPQQTIDFLLEQYKHFNPQLKISRHEKLIRSMARQQSVKSGTMLTHKEMKQLITDLWNCHQKQLSPDGKNIFLQVDKQWLEQLFQK